jgi:hypothetical protein
VAEENIDVASTEDETCKVEGKSMLRPTEQSGAETGPVVAGSSCKLNRWCDFLALHCGVCMPAHETLSFCTVLFGPCLEAVIIFRIANCNFT